MKLTFCVISISFFRRRVVQIDTIDLACSISVIVALWIFFSQFVHTQCLDAQIRARNETISAAKREKTSGGSGGDGNGTAHGATSASVYDIGTVPSEGRELVLHCAKVEASRQVCGMC